MKTKKNIGVLKTKTKFDNKKERVCLKFEGYIYLPREENANVNDLRYYATHEPGRIQFFDEYNNKKSDKMMAFDSLACLMNFIKLECRKRINKRVKRQKNSRKNDKVLVKTE